MSKSGGVESCVNIFVAVRGLVVSVVRFVAGLLGVGGFVMSFFCSWHLILPAQQPRRWASQRLWEGNIPW